MTKIVKYVRSSVQSNPPVDAGTRLQLELLRSGRQDEWTESEILEAAKAVGVADPVAFLDDFASWL